jgi:L-lactate dehydrogenase complex protein LldF
MSQPIHFRPTAGFAARAGAAAGDPALRANFRGAMDFLQAKRRTQFPDADELSGLRDLGEAIRRHALANLPDLLERLEAKLVANGVQVHWAETPAEANAIVLAIARRVEATRMVKGKSMVSEEVGLNHAMQDAGIEALETDMGEYIVQLADEAPSHIIMPAIHKTKQQIAALFAAKLPGVDYTENVDALIRIGREVLRKKFAAADIGLSGGEFRGGGDGHAVSGGERGQRPHVHDGAARACGDHWCREGGGEAGACGAAEHLAAALGDGPGGGDLPELHQRAAEGL